jgi:hypothetical protein
VVVIRRLPAREVVPVTISQPDELPRAA